MTFCVYCYANCDKADPEHLIACPFSTNLWPVLQQDIDCELGCLRCGQRFILDDNYVVDDLNNEILCITCAIDDWIK
jgi:hypothetical protein